MLQIFPFLIWLAPLTSAALLIVLWKFGELRRWPLALLVGWFLLAGYLQFFASSYVVAAIGLLFQTMLTIWLTLLWKLAP